MNQSTAELKAISDKLWEEVKALEVPYKAKTHEWCMAQVAFDRSELRDKMRAEIEAEKAATV